MAAHGCLRSDEHVVITAHQPSIKFPRIGAVFARHSAEVRTGFKRRIVGGDILHTVKDVAQHVVILIELASHSHLGVHIVEAQLAARIGITLAVDVVLSDYHRAGCHRACRHVHHDASVGGIVGQSIVVNKVDRVAMGDGGHAHPLAHSLKHLLVGLVVLAVCGSTVLGHKVALADAA